MKKIKVNPYPHYHWDVPIKYMLSCRVGSLSEIYPDIKTDVQITIRTWSDDSVTWDFVHGYHKGRCPAMNRITRRYDSFIARPAV